MAGPRRLPTYPPSIGARLSRSTGAATGAINGVIASHHTTSIRREISTEESYHAFIEAVVLVSGHHMPGAGDDINLQLWDETGHLLNAIVIDDITVATPYQQRGNCDVPAQAQQLCVNDGGSALGETSSKRGSQCQ